MNKPKKNNHSIPLFFALFLVLLVVSVFSRFMIINSADIVEDTTKQQLISLAKLASLLVTADELDEFVTPDDMKKTEYLNLKLKLIEFTKNAGIEYTYFLRLDNDTNMMQFIIDNTPEAYTALAEPQVEREPAPDLALSGEANAVDVGSYSEGWEGYITAFAPLYYSDGRESNIIAGVDMQDIYIQQTRRNISALSIVFIASAFLIFFVVIFMMASLLSNNNRIGENLESKTATLSTVFASIPDIVFSMDANLHYTSCNPSFEKFAGLTEAEIIGKSDFELFGNYEFELFGKSKDKENSIIKRNEKVLLTRESMLVEEVIVFPNGEKRHVESLRTPMIQNGHIIGILGIAKDVTERVESQNEIQSKNKLIDTVNLIARTLLSSKTDEFSTILQQGLEILGHVTEVDRVYIWRNWKDDDKRLHSNQLYEWSPEVEAQQGNNNIVIDMIYDENAPTWVEPLSNGHAVKGIVKNMIKEEREGLEPQGIVSILVVPITINNKFWGFIGFDDCHKERNFTDTEENILRSCGHMIVSSIIKNEMTTHLIEAKEIAQAASTAKSQFLATMSHEIRTPLNAIIGLSEIQLRNELPEETCSDLEKIHSSGLNLLRIINDVLDISKIEAGGFELVPIEYNTPSIINDSVQINLVRLDSKPVKFNLEVSETLPVVLYGDEMRVKQILNNLLSNAFKYTQNGTVTMKIDWEQLDNDTALLIVAVSDTGMGIKEKDMEKLFSEYSQLDIKANRRIEGTGLGLSITRKLLEMMDGSIHVESEYGKGSTFTVRFRQGIIDISQIGKTTAESLKTVQFTEERRATVKNLVYAYMPYGKVLVVDDVATNLDVAKGLMLPYGLKIDCATSGQEAVNIIREEKIRYDLVLMDHMMPEMDGVETVHIIRNEIETEYAKTVPIIALTANALAGYEEMFLASGFNAFISKPIDIMRLDVMLNQLIRNKQSNETLRSAPHERINTSTIKAKTDIFDNAFIEGIDIEAGVQQYNSGDIYFDIIRSYVKHTPELLNKLESVTKETLSQYAVTVHGLKGSSFGILAYDVGNQAEKLEAAAKSGDFKAVSERNGVLLKTANKLLSELDRLLQKINESEIKKLKMLSPDNALLTKMLEASKMFKTSDMDEIMAELALYQYESGSELIDWLQEQLDNLEYEAIQKRLESML